MSGLRNWHEQRNMVFEVKGDKSNLIGFPHIYFIGFPHIYFIIHHFKLTTSGGLAKLPLCVCVHMRARAHACICVNRQMNICYLFWVHYYKHVHLFY